MTNIQLPINTDLPIADPVRRGPRPADDGRSEPTFEDHLERASHRGDDRAESTPADDDDGAHRVEQAEPRERAEPAETSETKDSADDDSSTSEPDAEDSAAGDTTDEDEISEDDAETAEAAATATFEIVVADQAPVAEETIAAANVPTTTATSEDGEERTASPATKAALLDDREDGAANRDGQIPLVSEGDDAASTSATDGEAELAAAGSATAKSPGQSNGSGTSGEAALQQGDGDEQAAASSKHDDSGRHDRRNSGENGASFGQSQNSGNRLAEANAAAAGQGIGGDDGNGLRDGAGAASNFAASPQKTAPAAAPTADKGTEAPSEPSSSTNAPSTPENGTSEASPLSRLGTRGVARTDGSATRPDALSEGQRARFVQRVAGAFQAAQQRDGTVRVRLSPPELGSLRLQMTVRDGALFAQLETETPEARRLILEHLPELRDRLVQQEVKVERFDVNVRDEGRGQLPEQADDDSAAQNGSRRDTAKQNGDPQEGDDAGDAAAAAPADAGSDQLNIVV
ncbi:MAG: flagellar hook-length control protein FliK [Planctomycetota bacterium]|nr:MAG: flagellar hook-length control protein FliK [Planctomycetota bacterium]REK44492.1 MAG: flagellar hook-length control protein FliK [Planctomycetota bacterium]